MITKIKEWKDVCKIHWKEIISLAIALHWFMDLLIIVPISMAIGYLFGVHIGHDH
jgi:hypothetical protein